MSLSLLKRFKSVFKFLSRFILFIFVQKPWFKFKYLNQFSKFSDLKSPQKVYLNYTSLNPVQI
jgi:hypothetical protein